MSGYVVIAQSVKGKNSWRWELHIHRPHNMINVQLHCVPKKWRQNSNHY